MSIVVLAALTSFRDVKCQHAILLQLIWLRLFSIDIHYMWFVLFCFLLSCIFRETQQV